MPNPYNGFMIVVFVNRLKTMTIIQLYCYLFALNFVLMINYESKKDIISSNTSSAYSSYIPKVPGRVTVLILSICWTACI